MLDEYKILYQEVAKDLEGWQTIDKNELCRLYVTYEHDETLRNQYLSAIICRYWHLIGKFYALSKNLADPIDCYNWLVDAVMYTLKHRRWEDSDASISNDPQGPDKMINRCMKSCRLIHYQFFNRKKRRKEYQIVSLDELKDAMNTDSFDIEDPESNVDIEEIDLKFYIRSVFLQKQYFLAFVLDLVSMDNVFEQDEFTIKFNLKRVAKLFRQIDRGYVDTFAYRYDLDVESVHQAAILAKNVPSVKLTAKIQESLLKLKHSKLFKQHMLYGENI